LSVQYRFDDEVKDDVHGVFTPEMFNLPQATWISTSLEGVTDKYTGLPLFISVSVCEHCLSIEGWIHSQRRNRLDQNKVEKLVHTHTNLVLRDFGEFG
jgi:hypothetical protein